MPASAGDQYAIKNRVQLLQVLNPAQQKQAQEFATEYTKKFGIGSARSVALNNSALGVG